MFCRVIAAISSIHHCLCLLFSVVVNNSVLFSWDTPHATSVDMHATIFILRNCELSGAINIILHSSCIVNTLSSKRVMSIKKLINYGILKVKSDMGYCLDALPNSQNYTTAVKELGIVIEENWSIELRWTVTPHLWWISNFSLHPK